MPHFPGGLVEEGGEEGSEAEDRGPLHQGHEGSQRLGNRFPYRRHHPVPHKVPEPVQRQDREQPQGHVLQPTRVRSLRL